MSSRDLFARWDSIPTEVRASDVAKNGAADYRRTILACVKRGLEEFGGGVAEVVLYDLAYSDSIKLEEIPQRPAEFSRFLRRMFLSSASRLEEKIMAEVKSQFGIAREFSSLEECFREAARLSGKSARRSVRNS